MLIKQLSINIFSTLYGDDTQYKTIVTYKDAYRKPSSFNFISTWFYHLLDYSYFCLCNSQKEGKFIGQETEQVI